MRSARSPDSRARLVERVNGASALGSAVEAGLSGGDRVRFGTGSSGSSRGGWTRPMDRTTWSLRGSSERSVPYLAGRPARTWHLADIASVGCRGIDGPVPPPLWISTLRLSGDDARPPSAPQGGRDQLGLVGRLSATCPIASAWALMNPTSDREPTEHCSAGWRTLRRVGDLPLASRRWSGPQWMNGPQRAGA